MRRIGVIVALGALLSMFAGAVTAAPALAAGAGGRMDAPGLRPGLHHYNCGLLDEATLDVDKVFAKALKTPDGSMILLFTGAAKITFANPANGKSVSTNVSGLAQRSS